MSPFRIAFLAATAAASIAASPAHAADKVTFLTSWYAQAEHGGFYQAKATGLYDKDNLDVTIKMGGPQVNGMQLLLGGDADIIMGYDFQVLSGIAKGLPVITVAHVVSERPARHDDACRRQGSRRFEGQDDPDRQSSGRTSWWPWVHQKFGYTDAQLQPYTFNLQPFFADNNVAQQAYPSSEPFQAIEKNVPVNFFLFADYGYPPYGTTMVTTTQIRQPNIPTSYAASSKIRLKAGRAISRTTPPPATS